MNEQFNVVIKFLLGEGELDGCFFGEEHVSYEGKLWWRSHLRAALASQQAEIDQLKAANAKVEELQESNDNWMEGFREYSDAFRSLASYLSVGGFNSEGLVPPEVAEAKIRDGIEFLIKPLENQLESQAARIAELEAKLEELLMKVAREVRDFDDYTFNIDNKDLEEIVQRVMRGE